MQTLALSLSYIRTRELAQTLIGVLLLVACSQISIPLQPVPITLQTVAVMLIGLTFSMRPALSSVAIYLALAAVGAPVLSGWLGGITFVIGPTGGYLLGFLVSVYVMTAFRRYFQSTSFATTLANCALGTSVVFVFGVSWLAHLYGFESAITFGLLPFIVPGAVKALLLCGALRLVRS